MDFVKFKVNGVNCKVGGEVSSDTMLLDFIRIQMELRGTKYMCRQGGCGACIVTVVKHRNEAPESVNSCLVSVPSCHGWEITTIEALGNRAIGYHPLQTTLARENGTQCGYCSPGWIMAMYSLLKSNKNLSMLQIENSLASNTCRCTGYRPILDAFKKFASDAPVQEKLYDIEDLHLCKKNREECSDRCDESEWCFLSKKDLPVNITIYLKDGKTWFKVQYVNDIFDVLKINKNKTYMLVAGNTAKGAYPISEYPQILIDINNVSELKGYRFDQNLIVGAAVTLTNLIKIFELVSNEEEFRYLQILIRHLNLVAHIPVRNLGTIAGNLMIKHSHPEFSSDIFTIFETIGAQLTIRSSCGVNTITLGKFLTKDMKGKVIVNILIPPLNKDYALYTEKVAARAQNAHAIVNAGFLFKLDCKNTVKKCRITYGGLSPGFYRAKKTELFLIGKDIFKNETLQAALSVLEQDVIVTRDPPEFVVSYKKQLSLNLFYKGLLALCPARIVSPRNRSGAIKLSETRPVSTASQTFSTNPSLWPLNQPVQKLEALIQCSGEARYTDDIPFLPREVFAAFVLSKVALGTIETFDPKEALAQPGVISFYSAKDIPRNNYFIGPNIKLNSRTYEEILCSGDVLYYNQPIGIIVAETYTIAARAAELVKVMYNNLKKPVLDIRVAKNNPRRKDFFTRFKATDRGNEVTKVIRDDLTIFNQFHFCMETLSCVAWQTDGELKIFSPSQFKTNDLEITSNLLNILQNKVKVQSPRIGGAFGLKISRQGQVTIACTFVAYQLNRPCRMITPIRTLMRAVGKRFASSTNFEVGVNNTGIIQYINQDLYEDNGCIVNELLILLSNDTYNNCYNKARWNFTSYNIRTDTASNTWTRSPGTLETISAAEFIMERISYELGLDALEVRISNLDNAYFKSITEMIGTLKSKSNYFTRRALVDNYNKENRWKKRGLRFSLMKWTTKPPIYFNTILSVFSKDGSVALTHSGVETGQGINTKAAQACAYYLNIPLDKVEVKLSDTTATPNSYPTIASFTSQNIVLGIKKCCDELLERLEPIRRDMNNPTWEKLIAKAYELGTNLQVIGFVNENDRQDFDVYGVSLAEVELDILTGQWQIIRVDLIEDVGRSVNPDIDIGQIEGSFIMGLGYWTTENIVYNVTGEVVTDSTWTYWVPLCRDIPQIFNIYFRENSFSSETILGAKATGEPGINLAVAVPLAMREALVSARLESGHSPNVWFKIDGPYTVEKLCLAAGTKINELKFY